MRRSARFTSASKRRFKSGALSLIGVLSALSAASALTLPAQAQPSEAQASVPVSAAPTYTVSKIGKPFVQRTDYSRNVWDMTLWNGKIYLGSGDSTNNTGRTLIWTLDPSNDCFTSPSSTNDEQLDEYQIVNGGLCVVGHDNVYKNGGELLHVENGVGTLVGKIAPAAHLYSLVSFGGALFTSGGNWSGSDDVWRSTDGGATWNGVCTDAYTMPYINGQVLQLSGARA